MTLASEDFDGHARRVVLGDRKTKTLFVALSLVMTGCTVPLAMFLVVGFSGNWLMALVVGLMLALLMSTAAWDIARRSGERRAVRLKLENDGQTGDDRPVASEAGRHVVPEVESDTPQG
jgi:hypothetical protein